MPRERFNLALQPIHLFHEERKWPYLNDKKEKEGVDFPGLVVSVVGLVPILLWPRTLGFGLVDNRVML
jgi:hypothetical protein